MKKTIWPALLLCLLLAIQAQAAYPTTWAQREAYFAPLRAWYALLGPEAVIWATGDSWTCNAQSPGESHGWGSDHHGGGTSSAHNAIWADPTTSNGTTWLARLGWRVGTHRFGAEAIGGAQISNNNDSPANFEADVTIASWVDDAATYRPDIWFFYGGINDILGDGTDYASAKRKYLMIMDEMQSSMPQNTRKVVMTLQPCALDYVKMRAHTQAPWKDSTLVATMTACLAKQVIVDNVNIWLKDSLRIAAKAHNAQIDTTKLFTYDHVAKLQGGLAWATGYAPSNYPLALGGLDAGDRDSHADSLKWYALRVLRSEIESDSIHCNQKGLRQIGDSIATAIFGIDLDPFVAGTHKTLYVDKQNGHNWTNRGRETDRTTPLASIQCAVWRAWPGDTIQVIGTGNQALLATADAGTPATVSATPYELTINKPGLYFRFEPQAYVQGISDSDAQIHGTAAKAVGTGLFHPTEWSGGDTFELTRIYGVSLAWSQTVPTYNARIGVDGMTLDGLKLSGFGSTPMYLPNVDDLRLVDCEFIGGNNSGSGVVQYVGFPYADTTPDSLDIWIEGCTFFSDSSNVTTGNTQAWGQLNFSTPPATTPHLNDSLSFDGKIINCRFIGDAWNSAGPAVRGEWDGIDFIGNTFTDPAIYNYVMQNTRTGAASIRHNAKTHIINNTFDVETAVSCSAIRYDNVSQATPRADSLIVVNNRFHMDGRTYPFKIFSGGFNNAKNWFARNITTDWDTLIYDGNGAARSLGYLSYTYSPAAAPDTTTNIRSRNWVGTFSATSDSMMFGGLTTTTKGSVWTPAAYGVEHGVNHASVGATQYTAEPYVWLKPLAYAASYQQISSPWELLRLINNGVLPVSDSLTTTTWYSLPTPTTPWEEWQIRTWLDAYNKWPYATRQKIRWKIGSTNLLSYAPDGTPHVGPWGILAAINASEQSVSDSMNVATWYRIPKPTTRGEELQAMVYLDAYENWPLATRKKIRWRIE